MTEEALEIRDLKVAATKRSERFSAGKASSKLSDDSEGALSRKKRVRELVRTDHMAESTKISILKICEDFHDIFYLEWDKLSHTDLFKHSIPTPALHESRAINIRPYRMPEAHKEEVNRQISKLLDDGIIVPFRSAFNSPLLLVPKKADASGTVKWRVLIDFRKLNEMTVGDAYPLPSITDILDQLRKAKYFSTVGLASGYYQVELAEKNRAKTAFSTLVGHFEFLRLPMGLKSAPSPMNSLLAEMNGFRCFCYMDDVIITADSLQSHNERLRELFQRLRESKLKLEPFKCDFLRAEVQFLGHVATDKGLRPDPKKDGSSANLS
jgi:hypothetical protein